MIFQTEDLEIIELYNQYHIIKQMIEELQNLHKYLFGENLIKKSLNYIVLHNDKNRNKVISKKIPNLDVYELNGASDIFVDQIKILENAKEIHLIDSSWSVLIYFLSFHNEKIKLIPKFLHCYLHNGRDLEIYKNPIPKNWNFIY